MTIDSLDPAGVYFGTRSGQLYASTDEGKSWRKILDGLPAVVCVKPAVVGDSSAVSRPKRKLAAAPPATSKSATAKQATVKSALRRRGKP
jgi:hypothetical protein